jgi:asparagine synthase (glutamine-hydrolysing)
MCGVAGFIDPSRSAAELESIARAMASGLHHRGPDGHGVWTDAARGVALAHTRLSVIDLSPAGHQPMLSSDGRLVISYNGEIYNYKELHDELVAAGVRFRGHSDTEVLVEACARWGPARAVARCNGMFAFALWDREAGRLTLARDRIGIKPLFWTKLGERVLFGSELKAMRCHPGWNPAIDRESLTSYMRLGYVTAPRTMLRGVSKVVPGTILTFEAGREPSVSVYWSALEAAERGVAAPLDLDDRTAADELERLLADAVDRELVADVPLGAFLSGGIDSSTVVALMQKRSSQPVRTFSIGFGSKDYDEASQAAAVARHLGTQHTELYAEPAHAIELIPSLPHWFDEPVADPSQIATYLVARLARREVTVVLTGDGGDELFHGYDRYAYASSLWHRWSWLPRPVRLAIAGIVTRLLASPQHRWDPLLKRTMAGFGVSRPIEKLGRLSALLTADGPEALNLVAVTRWEDPGRLVVGGREPDDTRLNEPLPGSLPAIHDRLQLLDVIGYLPDDILAKVDRSTMAVSLEARVPILDHRVLEFAWRVPYRQKYREGRGKWLLRSVLYRHVPETLVDRPKMGFSVPVGEWLRGPLRDWAEELLSPARLDEAGFIAGPIRHRWEAHRSGARNWDNAIWAVLMFQSWHADFLAACTATTDARMTRARRA